MAAAGGQAEPTQAELGQSAGGCDPQRTEIVYSGLLNMESERTRAALMSDSLQTAVDLARKMPEMTDPSMKAEMARMGMKESQSIFFGPLRPEGASQSVTACTVQAEHAESVRAMGFELIAKHAMLFLPLNQDKFGEDAIPSHAEFIAAKAFGKFTKLLQNLGVAKLLIPIVMHVGQGLCVKYHVPQPELPDGSVNPQFQAHSVWTIACTDDKPPEVVKVGIRKGPSGEDVVLALPWNPMALDVCLPEKMFPGDWMAVKNADFGDAHFLLAEFETTTCVGESACEALVQVPQLTT